MLKLCELFSFGGESSNTLSYVFARKKILLLKNMPVVFIGKVLLTERAETLRNLYTTLRYFDTGKCHFVWPKLQQRFRKC